MPTARLLAIAILVGSATARADIINPDFRDVVPRMSFDGVQDHPKHVFLIHVRDKVYWGPGEFDSRVIPIPGPEVFTPGFRKTIQKVTVLAVPKAAYDVLSKEERQALTPESAGVLAFGIDRPQTSIGRRDPEPDTIRYRVAIADRKLVVAPVKPDAAESSDVSPDHGRRAWWAIVVAAPVVWLGLVVGRRLVRKTR